MKTEGAISLVVALLLAGCKDPREHAATPHEEPVRVGPARVGPARVTLAPEAVPNAAIEVIVAGLGQSGPRLAVPAVIEGDPAQLAHVGARVPGRVVALRQAVGATVRTGDILVEIDAVELHQVSTEFLTSVARDRQAQGALDRARALAAEHLGATQDLQRAEADAAAARASMLEAEEHLHFLGLREADITAIRAHTSHGGTHSAVRSPIDGTVSSLGVSLGQVVTGSEEVALVSRTTRVWCAVQVYERDLPDVSVGARVSFRPQGQGAEADRTGTLVALSNVLDPESRTAEGRFAIDNPDGRLRPGMSGRAWIDLPLDRTALWLPVEAVQTLDRRTVVFVETAPRTYEERPVRVGDERGGRVPVRAGVRDGERVVVRGALTLRGELERAQMQEAD